jgi:hypothetical protein
MKAKQPLLLVVLTLILLALALMLPAAAIAKPPGTTTAVSGDWSWVTNSFNVTPLPNDAVRVDGDEYGTWTGTFTGSSYDVFQMIGTPDITTGSLTALFTGWVGDKYGSMTMYFTISQPADDPVMGGTWVILSGTKALKHITGSGTWATDDVESHATYAGSISWK